MKALIEAVEERLAALYRFTLPMSASGFLMPAEQLVAQNGAKPPRAAVFLTQKDDELEIGLYLEEALQAILTRHDPKVELNEHNLDAYCALIEELSHFHLLLQRAADGRSVSQLELEWQGEVDKLLLSGLLMSEQRQVPCFRLLHHRIFEQAQLTAPEPHYEEAAHYAAKYWHRLLPHTHASRSIQGRVLPLLQETYQADWQRKVRIIRTLKSA